ncbi:MAG: DUF192 domain-containing protein [Xanthomonadales bacterium]|jgi:uncharacterized membrane protein (UPF0127 family)|nr:DUF192 domain-containing protein [Xanthomonadales bacterium]
MRNLCLALAALICTSCMAQEPHVILKGERFFVDLALDSDTQALGLMFREEMADDHGMLFVFPVEGMRSFWMKNCRIPLDIFYFDDELRLVNVAENARPCKTARCPSYPSTGPAQYVLELNAGKASELGGQPGDVLELHID